MRPILVSLIALVSASALASPAVVHAPIAAAIASPDRPAEDVGRDPERHPAALVAFAGVAPGQRVADILPGSGYFTRIFSKVVGPRGKVYALIPSELLQVAPKAADAAKAIAAVPAFSNVSTAVAPSAQTAAPEPLDVAWTSDNYHDLYGFFGADAAQAFDAAVYRMLRPGGIFIVVDHAAAAGDAGAPKALHRIDPAVVKAQVTAAGFVFEGSSDVLRNPSDTHLLKVFDPAIRGHTDQFVFKFRKPLHAAK